MVQVRLFGGVGAMTDAGDPVDVGPAKCQLVLAALALEPGVAVPVPRLVELVWGDDAPRTAERTLQSYVARIRRGLGAESIVRTGAAYRLDLDPGQVDVARFEARLGDGDVGAALAEWTGAPLAGLEAPGLTPSVDRLSESWLAVTEADLENRMDRDPASVIGPLTELSATHPYREGLWALLMTALYRADRQADALAAYRRARRILVDELGIEPGARLRELEALVLDQDDGLGGRPATAASETPPATDRRREIEAVPLPRLGGRVIGRERQLAAMEDALARSRLVTLTGPGGVGKTTLALAVAHQRSGSGHAVYFVDLSASTKHGDVARAVIDAIGTVVPEGTDLVAVATTAVVGVGPVLIVLDNCEQVVDGTATLVTALLDRCPEASVLLTSREPLGLVDERVVVVPPLDTGAAVDLFLDRAAGAAGATNQGSADIARLCERLEGVPLAIELAAARARTLTPSQLLERLDRDLRVLDARTRGRPARHRTLRASVEWSYDLLEPDERTVFERLSVFPGNFDLQAVEAIVTDDEWSPVELDDLLDRLVGQSMVTVQLAPSGVQFRLLAPMRDLAGEQLAARGHVDAVGARHTRWCLDELRCIRRLLEGHEEVRAVELLQERWADVRTAVDRAAAAGDGHLVRDLVDPIAPEVFLRSRDEIGEWAERVLDLSGGDEDLVVFGLVWAARRHLRHRTPDDQHRLVRRFGAPDHVLVRHADAFVVEDQERLVGLCEEAASRLRHEGCAYLADLYEIGVGRALLALGRLEEHDDVVGAMVERFRLDGPPTFLHWTLGMLGYSKLRQRQRDEADSLFAESAAVEIPAGTHSRSAPVAARMAARSGERRRAFQLLRDHAADLLERRDLYEARLLCVEVVNLLVGEGCWVDAARLLGYLEATGLLDNPAFAAIVSDSADAVERTVPDHARLRAAGGRLDDAAALDLVQAVADELAREPREAP